LPEVDHGGLRRCRRGIEGREGQQEKEGAGHESGRLGVSWAR
jgi:hypothetical protein